MTTKVRIEKADGGIMPLMVQLQYVGPDGTWVNDGPARAITNPAALLEFHIHQNSRIIVNEMLTGNA